MVFLAVAARKDVLLDVIKSDRSQRGQIDVDRWWNVICIVYESLVVISFQKLEPNMFYIFL